VLVELWTRLYYPSVLSLIIDPTFDNVVQGKIAGWII